MKHTAMLMLASAIALGIATLQSSCSKTAAAASAEHKTAPENGAQFKKGEGLSLTDEMKKAIVLQIADVGEEKVASAFTVNLSAMKPNEAGGWLAPRQAAQVKAGEEVELQAEGNAPAIKGMVQRVEQPPFGALGDYEITITTTQPLTIGARLKATFHAPAGDAVAAIPRSALLKTAEGIFVYAVNGSFYVRTPVKTGAMNDALVEITDGLYSGDQIVTTPVMSLWLAELQVLRGGKACTCGH
ncbi:MAG: hypothetical protein K1X78_17750 [Verrucomicrobiaceae bacterium]|nr:hypothetical protein [Verrucomicrobiaceae bacterium]